MTALPTQICRCEGGHLVPMSDSRPLTLDTLDAVSDINTAAAALRMGLYEFVFNMCSHLPVYVACVAGETSMGKSFQVR